MLIQKNARSPQSHGVIRTGVLYLLRRRLSDRIGLLDAEPLLPGGSLCPHPDHSTTPLQFLFAAVVLCDHVGGLTNLADPVIDVRAGFVGDSEGAAVAFQPEAFHQSLPVRWDDDIITIVVVLDAQSHQG